MDAPSQHPMPALWELLDDRLLRDCRVWDLRARRYRLPRQGKEADFFYIDSRDWVMVLAPTLQEQFIMVQQFRWLPQLSSGFQVELWTQEKSGAAAMRELREETDETDGGRIIQCNPNPAISSNTYYIVLVEPVRALPGAGWDPKRDDPLSEKATLNGFKQARCSMPWL